MAAPQQFATVDDFELFGLPPSRTSSVLGETIDKYLLAASARAESVLRASGEDLPLVAPFPTELVQAVCQVAAFEILAHLIGFNPEVGEDASIRQSAADALAWMKQLGSGAVLLYGTVDGTPDTTNEAPEVFSETDRRT